MTKSHITGLLSQRMPRLSAGDSLVGGIHPLAVLAYFEGANSPWEQRLESNQLLKDNETCDLIVCPRCYFISFPILHQNRI